MHEGYCQNVLISIHFPLMQNNFLGTNFTTKELISDKTSYLNINSRLINAIVLIMFHFYKGQVYHSIYDSNLDGRVAFLSSLVQHETTKNLRCVSVLDFLRL